MQRFEAKGLGETLRPCPDMRLEMMRRKVERSAPGLVESVDQEMLSDQTFLLYSC